MRCMVPVATHSAHNALSKCQWASIDPTNRPWPNLESKSLGSWHSYGPIWRPCIHLLEPLVGANEHNDHFGAKVTDVRFLRTHRYLSVFSEYKCLLLKIQRPTRTNIFSMLEKLKMRARRKTCLPSPMRTVSHTVRRISRRSDTPLAGHDWHITVPSAVGRV